MKLPPHAVPILWTEVGILLVIMGLTCWSLILTWREIHRREGNDHGLDIMGSGD